LSVETLNDAKGENRRRRRWVVATLPQQKRMGGGGDVDGAARAIAQFGPKRDLLQRE
jgi:hypothetical protein